MKKYAVVGKPLAHSLSPEMFNAAFKACGLDYEYFKLETEADDLSGIFQKLREGEYGGLSITVPYKEEAIKFVDELTPEAEAIGAINTAYRVDNKVIGDNTDWAGVAESLKGIDLVNKKILIYGAGGAARACLHALEKFKQNIFLTNRSDEKGRALAKKFGVKFVEKENLPNVDIFMNATSSGLGSEDERLVSAEWLAQVKVVFDLMYGDTRTSLEAKKLGIEVIDARKMLVCQGAKQFKFFTNIEAPIRVMSEAVGLKPEFYKK